MPAPDASPSDARHIPVMLAEVLTALAPKDGEVFIDGTLGAGGYTTGILASAQTRVVAIDRDPTAINEAAPLVDAMAGRLRVVEGRFAALDRVAHDVGLQQVEGVVLDIGVSSMQLDRAERGFSFRQDGPLDMRMGVQGLSAADLVNSLPEADLARIFDVLGEERRAGALARAIVEDRGQTPFLRTTQLSELCGRVIRTRPGDIHPATRAFQALRIAVNHELDELADALLAAERVLAPGGRLVVVSFHSLEDRIVKTFLADRTRVSEGGSRHRPVAAIAPATFLPITRGVRSASAAEAAVNPRARSAKLRAATRTDAPARDTGTAFLGLPDLSAKPGRRR